MSISSPPDTSASSRNLFSVLALAVIAAISAGYVLVGPSVLYGGPSKSEIIRVTRETMIAAAASPAEDIVAKDVTIAPQGFCSRDEAAYVCVVDISHQGAEIGSFVARLSKGPTGWAPAD